MAKWKPIVTSIEYNPTTGYMSDKVLVTVTRTQSFMPNRESNLYFFDRRRVYRTSKKRAKLLLDVFGRHKLQVKQIA